MLSWAEYEKKFYNLGAWSSSCNKNTHYENTPIQIYWKFHHQKTESFQIKILIFFIFLLKT